MTVKISQTADVQRFFEEASGQLQRTRRSAHQGPGAAHPRRHGEADRRNAGHARRILESGGLPEPPGQPPGGRPAGRRAGPGALPGPAARRPGRRGRPHRRHAAHHRRAAVRRRRAAERWRGTDGRRPRRRHRDVPPGPRQRSRRPAAGRGHRRCLARQYPRHLFLLRQQPVRIQPAPAHPHRRRRPLPCAQHRAVRLRLPERRPDPGTARPPRPPRPAAGAHSLLRLGARPSPPDHPDQPGGRPLPVGRLRLCHPRWADRRPALQRRPRRGPRPRRGGRTLRRTGFRLPASSPARRPPPSAAASGRGHCRSKVGNGEGGWSLATMPPSSARRDGG